MHAQSPPYGVQVECSDPWYPIRVISHKRSRVVQPELKSNLRMSLPTLRLLENHGLGHQQCNFLWSFRLTSFGKPLNVQLFPLPIISKKIPVSFVILVSSVTLLLCNTYNLLIVNSCIIHFIYCSLVTLFEVSSTKQKTCDIATLLAVLYCIVLLNYGNAFWECY